ncbi:hypothetical protein HELRODRAFT_101507, partial [Helobdella robusta]|uniref:Condensin complex subunit 1 C-terminal domain-containing protein n=1 Tax=Helobdella robusta TaxID=6412 RepID=T1ED50_HELRO
MVDATRAQTTDTEITKHCAYSFPAVAFALGRNHWQLLKPVFLKLVRDMQWKVRRTLSFSLHELAMVLGPQLTETDLLSVFDEFLKDVDDVRVGLLKHLADFFKLLEVDVRRQYLPKIADFLITDNSRNWRFRVDLAEQLIKLLDLFSSSDVFHHLSPIAFKLAEDSVAQVRHTSVSVLEGMIRKPRDENDKDIEELWMAFFNRVNNFHLSDSFFRRQLFAQICSKICENSGLPCEQFANLFLPGLHKLSMDKVPNVRLAVAVCMFKHMVHQDFFINSTYKRRADFMDMIHRLTSEKDRDLLFIIGTYAPNYLPPPPPPP